MEIITLICVIVSCLVAVISLILSFSSRSRDDGTLVQKINQALDGIEELKAKSEIISAGQHKSEVQLAAHEEQIRTLFKLLQTYDTTARALEAILAILQNYRTKGEHHE